MPHLRRGNRSGRIEHLDYRRKPQGVGERKPLGDRADAARGHPRRRQSTLPFGGFLVPKLFFQQRHERGTVGDPQFVDRKTRVVTQLRGAEHCR